MSPASQTLRRRTTRPRRPRPVHSRNHQERPQEYKDRGAGGRRPLGRVGIMVVGAEGRPRRLGEDRKSTRLNSSHRCISYAVFCLKKKKKSTNDENEYNK